MRGAWEDLIGRTITGIVVSESEDTPPVRAFLVLDGCEYLELFGDFRPANSTCPGSTAEALKYANKQKCITEVIE
jgi:hypothetical protein